MSPAANKITVLVVDDDLNNIEIIKHELETADYKVISASDGVEGWVTLQKNKDSIGMILLDSMMPRMNGVQFMGKLNEDETVSDIPVIMQTAKSSREDIDEGRQTGVIYYLTKPFDSEELVPLLNLLRVFLSEGD